MKKLKIILVFVSVIAILSALTGPALAATSPSLGAAASFAILAGTAITNVPTSAIIGDVGLSPAAGSNYAGLTAAEVTGTIYAVDATGPAGSINNPALLNTAKNDLTTAFNALSAPPNVACSVDYGAVSQDLAGLTLVPGIYCANDFTLSGTLTLDDTGNANGVWIFRAELSTLITSAGVGAKVQFLNGIGSACNVWWKVASSATIGSGTTFIGNILALTSISLGSSASLNGKALARNGAVTLNTNQINTTPCGIITTTTSTVITSTITTTTDGTTTTLTTTLTTILTTILTTARATGPLAVGGQILRVDALQLLAPYFVATLIAAAAIGSVIMYKRRIR